MYSLYHKNLPKALMECDRNNIFKSANFQKGIFLYAKLYSCHIRFEPKRGLNAKREKIIEKPAV